MALILNIDTATEKAGICLSRDGQTLLMAENTAQRDHASWLHPAIDRMMKEAGLGMGELDAIGVTAGPGSYTGLRVGMAAAKGFCYVLRIPLIAENTLKVMAFAASQQVGEQGLLCPMIDARRMEVFTAVYQKDMVEVVPPLAMIVDATSFSTLLEEQTLSFFGGGSYKCKPIITVPRAVFTEINWNVGHLGYLSFLRSLSREFTELAYSEPAYIKEFHTHTRK